MQTNKPDWMKPSHMVEIMHAMQKDGARRVRFVVLCQAGEGVHIVTEKAVR